MTGREDEHVLSVPFAGPCGWIVVHDVEIKSRHEIRAAHRSARMSGFGLDDHPDDVSSDLRGNLLQIFS